MQKNKKYKIRSHSVQKSVKIIEDLLAPSTHYSPKNNHLFKRRKPLALFSPQQQLQLEAQRKLKRTIIKVTSKQEADLFSFINHKSLPKEMPRLSVSRTDRTRNPESSLQRILDNKEKFVKTYFNSLRKYQKQLGKQGATKFKFPEVLVGTWTVTGMIRDDHLLLMGRSKKGKTIYKKYKYSKVYEKVKESYQNFVHEKFLYQI